MPYPVDKIGFKDLNGIRLAVVTIAQIDRLLVDQLTQKEKEQFVVVSRVGQIASESLSRATRLV